MKDSLTVRFNVFLISASSSSKLCCLIVTDLRSPLQCLFKCKSKVSAFPHHVPALVNSINQIYSPRTIQEDESERDESEMNSALKGIYKLLEGVKHIIIKINTSAHPLQDEEKLRCSLSTSDSEGWREDNQDLEPRREEQAGAQTDGRNREAHRLPGGLLKHWPWALGPAFSRVQS